MFFIMNNKMFSNNKMNLTSLICMMKIFYKDQIDLIKWKGG